jgi:hypothetical protein
MVDSVQLVLLIVIVVLTILLIALGIQVFLILSEVRKTVMRANKILDNADSITQSVKEPLAALSSLVFSVKASSFFTVAKFIKSLLSRDSDEERRTHRE